MAAGTAIHVKDRSTSLYRRILAYERENIAVARIIAGNDRYQGALREWAMLILERADEADGRKGPASTSSPAKRATAS
jgi:hypothetical protein